MNKKSKITLFILGMITVVLLILIVFSGNPNNRINGIYKFVGAPATAIQKGFSKIGTKLNNWFNVVTSYDEIDEELSSLRAENNKLKEYQDECNRLTAENEELREMISLKQTTADYELVAANTISGDVTDWFNYFIIDRGEKDGLKRGYAVITADGFVGIVSEVGATSSKIVNIVDEQNILMCRIKRSNELVRVRGVSSENLKYEMRLDRISVESDLFVGDELVTSASGDIIPEGISVGKVSEIIVDKKKGERSAVIDISVDLKVLSKVYVMVPERAIGGE